MSIQDDTTEYQDDEAHDAEQDNLRELREAAKSGKAAKAEADALKRELAFARAGIDTESTKGKMFVRAYDGDLDSAAIKAQFEEVFGGGDGSASTDQSDEDRRAAEEELRQQTQDRRDITSAGSDHTPPPEPNLIDAGYKRFEEELAAGKPREMAFREVLSGHIAAANAGQKNAVWSGWTDDDLDGWR